MFIFCCVALVFGSDQNWELLSDIDDTLYPILKDRRGFRTRIPYPGVKTLHEAFPVTFVTSRPRTFALNTYLYLRNRGFSTNIYYGKVRDTFSRRLKVESKKESIVAIMNKNKESSFFFIGDNGQGDAVTARLVNAERICPSFIHEIRPESAEDKADYLKSNVQFFSTYIEFAQKAFEQKIISEKLRESIIENALDEGQYNNLEFLKSNLN